MGRPKVYGKRSGAISIASYSKFAADSSGNETSPEVSVLCEVSSNVRKIPLAGDIPKKQQSKTLSKPATNIPRPEKHPSTITHPSGTANEINLRERTCHTNKISCNSSLAELYKGDDREDYHTIPKGTSILIPSSLRSPQRKSPRRPASIPANDLSILFNSLRLNESPEASIVVPQSSKPKTIIADEPISPKTRSYLSPILSCKNVTPNVSDFSKWAEARTHLTLEKIGEGSFGEVFRASSSDGTSVILKLMPLNMQSGKGSKSFTSVSSASNEIRLLERMQRVPGFVEFRGACVLVGALPPTFVKLWKDYKSAGRTVESRDPSKKTSYSSEQLWLLLEMSDAGSNLEPGQYAPPGEIATKGGRYLGLGRTWDIFWEVVKSIAKAEYWAEFEHRDLHLGNVCARDTLDTPDKEDLTFVKTETAGPIPVNRSKIEITIIDYSLSRAFMDNPKDVLYYDFKKDKHLLKGQGDLQYDMYRHMAAVVGDRSPKEYVPQTNVVWLWYLLDRLLAMTKELSARAKAKKRGYITREARILGILENLQGLINPEYMQHWQVDSATALLGMGIEKGWLSPDDVFE